MSASSKPTQQLITALWPECSDASAPRRCGFSPRSGDNGLSPAAWLTVRCVIRRMSASAESGGEGGIIWVVGTTGLMPVKFSPLKAHVNMVFTYFCGVM